MVEMLFSSYVFLCVSAFGQSDQWTLWKCLMLRTPNWTSMFLGDDPDTASYFFEHWTWLGSYTPEICTLMGAF